MSESDGNLCAFGHAAENGHCPGITKREWFAGQAMQALLIGAFTALSGTKFTLKFNEVAQGAYSQADARLQARTTP